MSLALGCSTCGCGPTSCEPCTTPVECTNCASCCCAVSHTSWRLGRIQRGLLLEYIGSAWMTVEVVGAIGAGLVAGSFALLAFGSDSLVELASGLAVARHLSRDLGGSTASGRRTAFAASVLLFALLPIIGLGAGYAYFSGLRPEASPLGIVVAAGAVLIMPYLWLEKRRIGRETRCLPLSADAAESATCFLMSAALLGSLLAEFFLGLWWVDYAATAFILAFVAKEAVEAVGRAREVRGIPSAA